MHTPHRPEAPCPQGESLSMHASFADALQQQMRLIEDMLHKYHGGAAGSFRDEGCALCQDEGDDDAG